jgi:predicted HicB family RNase H-like nuclease
MNKEQAYRITNTSEEEYLEWCKLTGEPSYKTETKKKFFSLILSNKLVRDNRTGKLIRKKPRRKK